MDIRFQPTIQIRSNVALLYDRYIGTRRASSRHHLFTTADAIAANRFDLHQSETPTYSGELKPHARKRLARAISLLNQASPWRKVYNPIVGQHVDFKLSFITLTIPDETPADGKTAYKLLLKPLLRILKARYKQFLYVYKAELQERGQLHYHITSNTLIPYNVIQSAWNRLLSQHSYMDSYIREHGHNRAPSVQVKRVQNISDIEAYLIKYVCKSDPLGRLISGKVWGCSRSLSGKPYFSEILNSVNETAIVALEKAKKVSIKIADRCTIIRFRGQSPVAILSREQLKAYRKYIQTLFLPEPVPM